MAEIRKYAFDTEFAPDGAILREARGRLTPEQVEADRLAAYEHGKRDAVALAERQAAAALEALAAAANTLLSRLDAETRAMRAEAAKLALVAARKIAGEALDGFGAERAASAIEAAMDALRHQPRLLVRLAPDALETLRPRLTAMTEAHGYAGAILLRAEPGMRAGDIAIDWSDGIVAMSAEDAAQRVNQLVEAALANAQ
jgi:flagellar assembly protein FliH